MFHGAIARINLKAGMYENHRIKQSILKVPFVPIEASRMGISEAHTSRHAQLR